MAKGKRIENALMVRLDQLQKPLVEFVEAIEATGGVKLDPEGSGSRSSAPSPSTWLSPLFPSSGWTWARHT